MKLVHISDIHINPAPVLGLDPVANFKACLACVEAHDSDADRVVITGDLTHYGQEESYRILASILAESPLQGLLGPRLLIGNHDHRATFRSVFADHPAGPDGFLQWTETTPAGLFVYMDSVDEGLHSGRYCAPRRAWLESVLGKARAAGQRAFLFMHHNPVAVHVANADIIGFVDESDLQALIEGYRDVIAHIFFGHCHYSLSGVVCGVPYSAPRSTNHACWPDFTGTVNRTGYGDLSPNYNVCFLNDRSTVIHSVDFLDAGKVRWHAE